MAVTFKNLTSNVIPQHMSYEIRPYQEHVSWETKRLYKTSSTYTPDLGSAKYLYQGFLALQMALETSFIEIVTNKDLPVTVSVQEFPFPPHTDTSGTMDMLNYVLPLATVLTFTFSCAIFMPRIIEDKASGMKEFLKINGVSSWVIWTGWFFDEIMINIITTGIITLVLKVPFFTVATPPIEHCDPTLLVAFLGLYSISTVSFCLGLSSIFNNSTYSVVVGLIVWILSYIIPNSVVHSNITLSLNLLYGIFPNGLLIFGFKILSIYEIRNTKLTWTNIFEAPSGGNYDLTMGLVLIMFLCNIIFYLIIALYVEQFFPGPYGIPKRLRFSIKGTSSASEQMENCDLPVSIEIKNLTKRFGNKTVVDNLSINIYDEQITVLLGRNGAGKTTMLSMITGMLTPTSGTVNLLRSNGSSISFCPQHNLQFSSLTVLEHLVFFGQLKGLSKSKSIEESKELLKLTNLTHKENEFISSLSDGMRRKLSLAIAVVGNSKIIILDEPSTGLDPEVRRDIWNFIITLRGFRTLIVTTHLMEEAEALSDRIIIIGEGSIVDYGSPLYLYKKYGVGYKLHLNLKEEADSNRIMNCLDKHQISIEFSTNRDMKILFDKSNKKEFISLLQKLEDEKERLNIAHLNFTHTTLEDVFLNVGGRLGFSTLPSSSRHPLTRKVNRSKYLILLKKWIKFTKWTVHIIQMLMLVLILTSILFLGEFSNQIVNDDNLLEFKLNKYGMTKVFYSTDNSSSFYQHVPELYSNLVEAQLGDTRNVFNVSEAIINEGLKNIEFYKKYMVVSAEFVTSGDHKVAKAMYSNNAVHASPISLNLLLNTLLKQLAGNHYSISGAINPLPYQIENKLGHIYSIQLMSIWCLLLPLLTNLKQLQLISGVSSKQYWFTCYLWNLILYIGIVSFALLLVYIINVSFAISQIFTLNEIATLMVILLVYGVAVIPYAYLYSYRRSRSSTLGLFVILNLFISHVLIVFILYLESSNDDCLEKIAGICIHVLNFFPVFGLQHTIAEFVKKAIWNYNWNHTSMEHKEAICKSNYNPCCDNNVQQCVEYQSYLNNNGSSILYSIIEILVSTLLYILFLCLVEIKIIDVVRKPFANIRSKKERKETPSNTDESTVKDLSKKFGNKLVLKDINFSTGRHECLGLLGANGAGKTTISRLLSTEEIPDSGEINRYDSQNCLVDNHKVINLLQKPSIKILLLDLKNCAEKKCNVYSGGNKRKLSTAIALIGSPRLIVLDEPTAGVDPVSRQKMRNELKIIKERSSMIISTHIMDDCEVLCNKVALLKRGQILEQGSIAALKNKMNQIVTVKLKIKTEAPKNGDSNSFKRKKIIKEMQEWDTEESEDVRNLKADFYKTFTNADLEDQHATMLKYSLDVANTRYNDVFRKVDLLQRQHSVIEDYDIATNTLEDVFLTISNQDKSIQH
ncbi:hypothetical protein RN001_000097 [Aquatica leii]|uniref:ABC transporter domain-containing protein n=1 Tax=Aquatica leii TaxID=1421715 RepID=A0AAN7PJK6_9COLE|nr:hypothetical protein RN001_000097 [Aquatica leii]